MLGIYAFRWDTPGGQIEARFAAEDHQVQARIGTHIDLGEVDGPHSRIYGVLAAGDIRLLTTDREFIRTAIECGLVPVGPNPMDAELICGECTWAQGQHDPKCGAPPSRPDSPIAGRWCPVCRVGTATNTVPIRCSNYGAGCNWVQGVQRG